MLYGYARVSTDGQDTRIQAAALRRAGCKRVVCEKLSGCGVHRPALAALVADLRAGDQLIVCKVDRLARSLVDLLGIVQRVDEVGASVRSLGEPFDTGQALGRLMLQLLGAFAEWERTMIVERCRLGREAARARGVKFGKPRTFDYARAAELRLAGVEYPEIARLLGSHPGTVRHGLTRLGLAAFKPRRAKAER